jgi:penicillin amidase
MASDPHLALTMPGIWYLAHLSYGNRSVSGATLPGIPAILLGHTNDVAWSFTSTGADVQDLVLERVAPDNLNAYLTPDNIRLFDLKRETIRVRFGSDHIDAFRKTRNGPILPVLENKAPSGHVYALKWAALSTRNRTFDAAFAMLNARTVDEAREALRPFHAPVQSVLLADRHGAIAFQLAGAIPVRAQGDGTVPTAGWQHETIWTGQIPFGSLPVITNPKNGILYTANHDIRPENYKELITKDWHHDGRPHRIEKVLGHKPKYMTSDHAAIQLDARTSLRDNLLPLMLSKTNGTPQTQPALDLMTKWDGAMAKDNIARTIFMAWLQNLMQLIARDELGDISDQFKEPRTEFLVHVLSGQAKHWCDNIQTLTTETCARVLGAALVHALDDLKIRYGANPKQWRWGKAHEAIHTHAPFGFVPGLSTFFSRRVESPGGSGTINRGSFHWDGKTPFANIHGAGYRAIYDLAEPSNSRWIISTGQSGHPLSPHYHDLMKPWAAGTYLPMNAKPDHAEAEAIDVLTLHPGG